MSEKGVGMKVGAWVEATRGSQKGAVGTLIEWDKEKKKWFVDFENNGEHKVRQKYVISPF